MKTRDEFIEREIAPTLGEYVDEYDLQKICDQVSEYDSIKGYVWKEEYKNEANYWAVVQSAECR